MKYLLILAMFTGCGVDESASDKYKRNFDEYQKERIERLRIQQEERKGLRSTLFDRVDYDKLTVDEWYDVFHGHLETAERLFEIEGCLMTGPARKDYKENKELKKAWKEFFDCEEI